MAIVQRSPLTNYRSSSKKGIVRYLTKTGASVTFTSDRRPVGTSEGQPDMKRSYKEVLGNDKAKFTEGKNITRSSVYSANNVKTSGSWGGTRSRTK